MQPLRSPVPLEVDGGNAVRPADGLPVHDVPLAHVEVPVLVRLDGGNAAATSPACQIVLSGDARAVSDDGER